MATKRTIVILGGALAGPTAAARARETDERARIVMLERGAHVSYPVGGLSNALSGEVDSTSRLDRERAEFFRDVYDVEVRTGVDVTSLDVRRRVVAFGGESLGYDAMVYAAGASTVIPDVPGLAEARNVFPFRSLENVRAIASIARRGRRVAVIGGAFFGTEAADGLLRRGVDVVIVERGPRLLPSFSTAASGAARAALEAAGAKVLTSAIVVGVETKAGAVRALRLADGSIVACDAVVLATGVRPRTEMLAAAGARVLLDGSLRVDEHCATSIPNVWACGSCVALEHAVSGRLVWVPQASIADKTAQVAGACAAGGDAQMGPILGTAILRVGALTVARTGLTASEADGCDVASVHAPSHDRYLPDATNVSLELMFDPRTGQVLGADAWGERGVDKRIDVIATAIAGVLGLDDLASMDLAYAPPYGTARDVVNVAATVAAQARETPGISWTANDVALALPHGGVTLVHVRDARGAVASIEGATGMTLAELRAGASTLDASPGVVVFLSEDGGHAYLAAKIARARGVADAGYLSGGIASWRAEGFTTVNLTVPRVKKQVVAPAPAKKAAPAPTPATKVAPAKKAAPASAPAKKRSGR